MKRHSHALLPPVLACLLLAVLASWPLAPQAGRTFPSASSMPDLNVSMWLPSQIMDAARRGHSPLWAADFLWPDGQSVALLVWNLGIQLMQMPFYLLFPPIAAYSLSLVFMGMLNGLGGFVLGYTIGNRDRFAGMMAAGLLVCNPFAWNELVQGRIEQGLLLWMALAVAGLLAQRHTPDNRTAVLTGAAWGMAGLCYWFYGYFLLLLVMCLLGEAAVRRRWTWLRALIISSVTSAAMAAPFALSLLWMAAQSGSLYQQTTSADNAMLQQVITEASLGLHNIPMWFAAPPEFLRDVLPVTALVMLAAWVWAPVRRHTAWLMWAGIAGLVLAMGPILQSQPGTPLLVNDQPVVLPLAWMQHLLPGFSRLWWPYRFQVFLVLACAGCAAALVAALPRRARWVSVGVVLTCALGELRLAQQWTTGQLIWDQPEPVVEPAFFASLNEEPGAHPLLMLPYQGLRASRELWQPYHRQPTSAGPGDTEDILLPISVTARRDATPVLRTLREYSKRPPNSPVPRNLPSLRDDLGALGFHYAILWRETEVDHANQENLYTGLLGTPDPDLSDERILVWKLSTW